MAGSGPETFSLGKGFKFAGGGAAGPSGLRLEDRVGVQAPPEVIWALVHDVAGWSAWNPLYPKAAGVVRIGEVLTLERALAGRPRETIRPRVLEWVPNEQLHWKLSQLGGLAVATGYIEIEKLAEASCIVAAGELVSGFLSPFVVNPRALRRGLHQMNEALKAAAEARWRIEGGAPTSGT